MRRIMRNSDKERMLSEQAKIELKFAELEAKKAERAKAETQNDTTTAAMLEKEIDEQILDIEAQMQIMEAIIGYEQ